ncbi:MAG: hypothetical protein RLZ56_1203 [Bacteroidota bacterium]|jgi:3',5'-cyclic-nucleotide phosphodiesterase
MKKSILFLILLFGVCKNIQAQNPSKGFLVLPLGVKGGLDESNLSAYLVSATGSNQFVCLDAGTINAGLQKFANRRIFPKETAESIQRNHIKAYFISHGHLDHLAGLVMNAPNDLAKPIYALPSVIEVFKNNYFTWKSWANFANEGEKPTLNKYTYQTLTPEQSVEIPGTELSITAFPLSHMAPYESTAFLVRNQEDYLLYLGDTGADSVEKTNHLAALWKKMAPLVMQKKLAAIFIEVSFDNSIPNKLLFGHLTPQLLMQEMDKLNILSNGQLANTKIVITHMKPCDNCETHIREQIAQANHLGLNIVFPEQGKPMQFN